MFYVLITLILVDLAFFVVTAGMGMLLESGESLREHLLMGVVTAILLTFTHCLVLFYLIGSEGDVKEALEGHPAWREKYGRWAKGLKREAFPWGSLAVLLTIVAALMGAEVHSRLLLEAPPTEAPPLRGVTAWWIHLVFVILALSANGIAFFKELRVVRENRRGITEINELLAAESPRERLSEEG